MVLYLESFNVFNVLDCRYLSSILTLKFLYLFSPSRKSNTISIPYQNWNIQHINTIHLEYFGLSILEFFDQYLRTIVQQTFFVIYNMIPLEYWWNTNAEILYHSFSNIQFSMLPVFKQTYEYLTNNLVVVFECYLATRLQYFWTGFSTIFWWYSCIIVDVF